jgi:hypothetical protein
MITEYTRTIVGGQSQAVPFPEATYTSPSGLTRQAALNLVNEWNRIAVLQAKPGQPIYIYTVD